MTLEVKIVEDVTLEQVTETLWRERELLERLAFKLDVERLLAESGGSRWQARAGREVDLILDEVRRTELLRAVQCDAVATTLGAAPGATLRTLAAAAAEPWRTILGDHHGALCAATAEVTGAARRRGPHRTLEGAW